jgi:hypothetical protein
MRFLVELDTRELTLEASAAESDLVRYSRESEKALAAGQLAEMQIAAARAQQAAARLEIVRYQLRNAQVRAPYAGVVIEGDLRKNLGAPVRKGDLLIKLAKTAGAFLELEIDQAYIHEVRVGSRGQFALVGRPEERFDIAITRIEPAATHKDGRTFSPGAGRRGRRPARRMAPRHGRQREDPHRRAAGALDPDPPDGPVPARVLLAMSLEDAAARTFSDAWHRVAGVRAALRTSVVAHRQYFRGEGLDRAARPIQPRVVPDHARRLGVPAPARRRPHGRRAWNAALEADAGQALTQEEVVQLLGQLNLSNLLQYDRGGSLSGQLRATAQAQGAGAEVCADGVSLDQGAPVRPRPAAGPCAAAHPPHLQSGGRAGLPAAAAGGGQGRRGRCRSAVLALRGPACPVQPGPALWRVPVVEDPA